MIRKHNWKQYQIEYEKSDYHEVIPWLMEVKGFTKTQARSGNTQAQVRAWSKRKIAKVNKRVAKAARALGEINEDQAKHMLKLVNNARGNMLVTLNQVLEDFADSYDHGEITWKQVLKMGNELYKINSILSTIQNKDISQKDVKEGNKQQVNIIVGMPNEKQEKIKKAIDVDLD